MVNEFIKLDYNVVSGETMNHCMLIDLRSKILMEKLLKIFYKLAI